MKRRRKNNAIRILGIVLGIAGVIIVIHIVPLYIWYIALAIFIFMFLFLVFTA